MNQSKKEGSVNSEFPVYIFYTILMVISSCVYHSDFTNHTKKTFEDGKNMKLNGIYFAETDDSSEVMPHRYMILYSDGSACMALDNFMDRRTIAWSRTMFDSTFSWKYNHSSFFWGIYVITADTLSVQSFVSYSDDYSKHVREFKYKINDSGQLLLVNNHCICYKNRQDHTIHYQPFIAYTFHEYPYKPDSSSIWFKKKKWYKKDVKNSFN